MKLIWFLFKSSWVGVTIAAIAGAISGFCNASSVALITQALKAFSGQLLAEFFGLAVIAVLTDIVSQFLLADLNARAVSQLLLRLSQQILACPLSRLESLGNNCILATLTEDINTLATAVSSLPFICIDIAIATSGHGALDTVEGAVWRVERNELIDPGRSSDRCWVVDFLVKYVRPDKVDGCYLPGINDNTEPLWNTQRRIAEGSGHAQIPI
jgi:ABC-type multidrug transport system fused ATPase/permease subunit